MFCVNMVKNDFYLQLGLYLICILLGVLQPVIRGQDLCTAPDTLTTWVGDAPYCNANNTFCSHFALDYVCNDTKGDNGEQCKNGTKVLCSYPDSEPLSLPTPATVLKVLVYNVWELRYAFAQNGQVERTCRIPRELFALHPDLDVIVFNEVFMGGCFSNDSLTLRDIIRDHGFIYYTKTVGEPVSIRKPENGGVFIASRWPIGYEEQMVFQNAEKGTADFVSGKGTMYAKIEKTVDTESRTYHIFGTHLQAQNSTSIDAVRVAQALEMSQFMQNQDILVDEPVIYAGDLNADNINNPNHVTDVLIAMGANLPQIVGSLQTTYDGSINDVFFDADINKRLFIDYVLYSDSHLPPARATLEVLRPLYAEHFDVCMAAINPRHTYPDSDLCFIRKSIRDLSDHFPVLGVFDYGNKADLTTEQSRPTSGGQRLSIIFMLFIFCLISNI